MPSLSSIPGRVRVTLGAKRMGNQSPESSCWGAGACGDLPKIPGQKPQKASLYSIINKYYYQ